MSFHRRKLLTVVTESALERQLVHDVLEFGAHGYTISEARGGGAHGEMQGAFSLDSNIRMDVICDDTVAERLALHLRDHYYSNYAMVVFLSEVEVLRPEKF